MKSNKLERVKAIALIPARQGSQRVKDKNILKINDHPLLAYTIRAAIDSQMFEEVVCVTDSKVYADIAIKYGASVPKMRPKFTATSTAPDILWVQWILKLLIKQNKSFDIFSILRPTNPLRTDKTIIRAFKEFLLHKNSDSLRGVEIATQHPGKMWVLNGDFMHPLIKKSINGTFWHSNQTKLLPKYYVQNASMEISLVENVMKYNSISGKKIVPFKTLKYEGFDINYPEDIIVLKYLLENKLVKLPKLTL